MSRYIIAFVLLVQTCCFADKHLDEFYIQNDTSLKTSNKVDLVIFSFDRPLQVYALLESCEHYFSGLNSLHLVYRCSDDAFNEGYKVVKKRFPYVIFHKQSNKKAGKDFKKLLLDAVFGKKSKARYIMFAVDDMLVTNFVNLSKCVDAMRKKHPWFFSLRLGKNIQLDTILNIPCPPPKRKKYGKNMFSWKFKDGKGGWNYPNTVDMTIYRKKDVRYFLTKTPYTNPNILEGAWSLQKSKRRTGLAFNSSKVVNIPLNVVNPYWTSQSMEIPTSELLEIFNNGQKIDIAPFYKMRPYATHVPATFSYIPRKDPKSITHLTDPLYFLEEFREPVSD